MRYVGLRKEPRVGVANFTIDIEKGRVYEGVEPGPDGRVPNGTIPEHIAKYLCSHHILADAEVSLEPAVSPDPSPRPRQAILVEGSKPAMGA